LNVRNTKLINITTNNSDVYFVEYNLLNELFVAMTNSSNFYAIELEAKTTE